MEQKQKDRTRLVTHERESWINHNGQSILFHDYSGLPEEDVSHVVSELTNCIVRRGERDLLYLVDVTGLYGNRESVAAFKEGAARGRPFIKKTAAIGVKGIVKVFLQGVNKFSQISAVPFETQREACDWLVS